MRYNAFAFQLYRVRVRRAAARRPLIEVEALINNGWLVFRWVLLPSRAWREEKRQLEIRRCWRLPDAVVGGSLVVEAQLGPDEGGDPFPLVGLWRSGSGQGAVLAAVVASARGDGAGVGGHAGAAGAEDVGEDRLGVLAVEAAGGGDAAAGVEGLGGGRRRHFGCG
ncbi:hypothetical protein TCAP_04339, partial [Tolypocladium capitatum]